MKEKKKERSLLILFTAGFGCGVGVVDYRLLNASLPMGFISGRTGVQMIATVIPCTESGRVSRITYFFVKINTGIDQVCTSDEVIDLIF